jgi:hypothetical protein
MRTLMLAALLAATAMAVPALAAPGDNPRRRLDFIDNAGTLHELDLANAAKIAMFKAHARALPPGTLVMTVDGQLYIATDSKMPGGEMMSDDLMH